MKTFYQILANSLFVSVINFTVWFALIFFAYLETRSVMVTGVMSGIYLVMTASTGIWFGSLVDHNKKKKVMLISALVSLAFYLVAFLLYLLTPAEVYRNSADWHLWVVIILSMLGVMAGNIRGIALPTLVTILIPEDRRDKANGLVGTVTGVTFLITSVISGLLVAHSKLMGVFILALTVTVLALLHLAKIKIEEKGIVHLNGVDKIDLKGTIAAVKKISGLLALIFFSTFNNFLGGVFMALMDAYGLSMVSVQVWGLLWGVLSTGFIFGGLIIAKRGLGKNPLRSLFMANLFIWTVSSLFTVYPSIILLAVGMFMYITVMPFIEASEQTIIQKLVAKERQGRVFGFAQSVEQAASPLTAFLIGPLTQYLFIPFMTTGKGVGLIGVWFGTGQDRGIALVFTLTGILGLLVTIIAMRSKYYRQLSVAYLNHQQ